MNGDTNPITLTYKRYTSDEKKNKTGYVRFPKNTDEKYNSIKSTMSFAENVITKTSTNLMFITDNNPEIRIKTFVIKTRMAIPAIELKP